MARRRAPLSERSPILRMIARSRLNPAQRIRTQARENQLLTKHVDAHPAVARTQKSVMRAEKNVQRSRESQASIEAARLRTEAMRESSKTWVKGTQWIKQSAAWVRKKSIPMTNPLNAWRASRLTAREARLEEVMKGNKKNRENLQESARLVRERTLAQVTKQLPRIRKRVTIELDEIIKLLSKPPFSGRGKSQLQIARGYFTRLEDPETIIRFDRALQQLQKAIRQKNTAEVEEIALQLKNFE